MATDTRQTPAAGTGIALNRTSFDWRGTLFEALLLLCLLFALGVLTFLIVDVVSGGAGVFAERGTDFLTSNLSSRAETAGVWQAIYGSLFIALFVALFAIPVGVMTAVYLEEYAPDNRATRFINVNIRNLAGVPSVVYGLLGLAVFVPLVQAVAGGTGRNIISASITLGVLVLPIVIITAAESLRAVPSTLREAGYGVGASRWEVTSKLVIPAAGPGILTGMILSLSRALGETAPLIIIGASWTFFSSGDKGFVEQLFGSFTALPIVVFGWASNPQQAFRELTAAAIIVLLIVTLAANAVAILLRNRYERSW
jgi:phosphate transport system permease protein